MSAGSIPVIIFKRVDFPAPLIPTIAALLKEQDLIITSVPKDLLILLQERIIITVFLSLN